MILDNILKSTLYIETEDDGYDELFIMNIDDITSANSDEFTIRLLDGYTDYSFKINISDIPEEHFTNASEEEPEQTRFVLSSSYLVPTLPFLGYCTYKQLYSNNFRKMHHIPMIRNKKDYIPFNRPIPLSCKAAEWLVDDVCKHTKCRKTENTDGT